MRLFTVRIVTPTGTSTYQAEWVDITTPTGNQIIEAGHAPMISLLRSRSVVTLQTDGGAQETIPVLNGVIEVTREMTTIVTHQA